MSLLHANEDKNSSIRMKLSIYEYLPHLNGPYLKFVSNPSQIIEMILVVNIYITLRRSISSGFGCGGAGNTSFFPRKTLAGEFGSVLRLTVTVVSSHTSFPSASSFSRFSLPRTVTKRLNAVIAQVTRLKVKDNSHEVL